MNVYTAPIPIKWWSKLKHTLIFTFKEKKALDIAILYPFKEPKATKEIGQTNEILCSKPCRNRDSICSASWSAVSRPSG